MDGRGEVEVLGIGEFELEEEEDYIEFIPDEDLYCLNYHDIDFDFEL